MEFPLLGMLDGMEQWNRSFGNYLVSTVLVPYRLES